MDELLNSEHTIDDLRIRLYYNHKKSISDKASGIASETLSAGWVQSKLRDSLETNVDLGKLLNDIAEVAFVVRSPELPMNEKIAEDKLKKIQEHLKRIPSLNLGGYGSTVAQLNEAYRYTSINVNVYKQRIDECKAEREKLEKSQAKAREIEQYTHNVDNEYDVFDYDNHLPIYTEYALRWHDSIGTPEVRRRAYEKAFDPKRTMKKLLHAEDERLPHLPEDKVDEPYHQFRSLIKMRDRVKKELGKLRPEEWSRGPRKALKRKDRDGESQVEGNDRDDEERHDPPLVDRRKKARIESPQTETDS